MKIKSRNMPIHLNRKAEWETILFDIAKDSGQDNKLNDVENEMRMITLMKKLMQDNDAPMEQYERLGL